MPRAVELYVSMGVAGCGCPISLSAVFSGTASWPLVKRPLTLALNAETTTFFLFFNVMNGTVWRRHSGWKRGGVLRSVAKVVVSANTAASFRGS